MKKLIIGFVGVLSLTVSLAANAAQVRFVKAAGFSEREHARLESAGQKLEAVLNSPEFKQRVLEAKFIDLGNMPNQEIYDTIMRQDVTLDVAIYSPPWWNRKGTVGYTNPNDPTIHMNRWYYSRFDESDIAGNLAHEWMHKLGFDHDYKSTRRRPYSVPYLIGDLVVELASPK